MGRPATDKRQRLIAAATESFHRRGFARTSVADVARAAGIPAGNVFYYFKAKDELAKAVVDLWVERIRGYLAEIEPDADPWARIDAFIDQAALLCEMYVTLGCPMAGLARDLRRDADTLAAEVPRIYAVQFEWLGAQFEAAGFNPAQAARHTRFLLSAYHGAIMLAYAQGDDVMIHDMTQALKIWAGGLRTTQL